MQQANTRTFDEHQNWMHDTDTQSTSAISHAAHS